MHHSSVMPFQEGSFASKVPDLGRWKSLGCFWGCESWETQAQGSFVHIYDLACIYIIYNDYYILYMIIIYYIYMSTLIIWLIMIVCFVDFDFLTCLIIPHLEDSKVARMWSSEFTGRRLTLDMSANCFGPHYFFRRIRRLGSICFVIEFVWYIIYIFCLESSMGKGPLGTCFKGHFFIFFETRDAHCFDLTLFGCLQRRTSNAQ